MVSCPKPDHLDRNPSAWLNSELNTWFCGGCNEGGDIMDLAAIKFGIDYRSRPDEFHDLLEVALRSIGHDPDALRAENALRSAAAPTITRSLPSTRDESEPLGREDSMERDRLGDEDQDTDYDFESILDWREIVADYPDSFLAQWMEALHPSGVPDEYLLWLGLQAIGLAVGRNCWLNAETPIYPNLLLAVIGKTGWGKSRAVGFLNRLLGEALPFDPEDKDSKGVRLMGRPASGEALLQMFSWMPPGTLEPQPLRGLIDVDEMSELMAGTKRIGATLKETVITLFDGRERVEHVSRSSLPIVVNRPFMSVIVGTQPDAMSRFLDSVDTASGFANRFIYVAGKRKPRIGWHDRPEIDLSGLDLKLQNVRAWAERWAAGREHGSIDLDLTAGLAFDDMMGWIDYVRSGPNGDIFARLELHAMKLIVILCANARQTEADTNIINTVRKLIESLVPTANGVSELVTKTEDQWYSDRVAAFIQKCEDLGKLPPTRRDIVKSFTVAKRDANRISASIAYLEKIGRITRVRIELETGHETSTPKLSTTWRFELNQ